MTLIKQTSKLEANDPNDFDRDNDGIGCEADDINNNNGTRSGDLNCGDIEETNIPVGSNDPNNFDAIDGIGCETQNSNSGGDLNCGDIGGTNITVGSNDPNNLDADGDGIGCETAGGDDGQTNDDDSQREQQLTEDKRQIHEMILSMIPSIGKQMIQKKI